MKRLRVAAFLLFVSTVILTAPRIAQARHFDEACDAPAGATLGPDATDLQVLTECCNFVADYSDSYCENYCGSGYACDSAVGCEVVTGGYNRSSSVTLHCKRPSEM